MYAGQRVILSTPMESSSQKSLLTCEFPILLHSVDDHFTFTGLCWTPWPQKQGRTLLSSGGGDGDFFAKPGNKLGV